MKTLARPRDKAEIVDRLRTVRPESVRRWGKMSPHQMVCHLNDSILAVIGRKPVSDMSTVLSRTVVKWVALYLPLHWPVGIRTMPEIDQELGGTRPAEFAADVAQLETLLDLIATQRGSFEWKPHPIFGRMSDRAWMRWAYLHADHHFRQFGA
jgi:hypothetical protein